MATRWALGLFPGQVDIHHAVTAIHVAVLPFHIVDSPFPGGADPGAHDFAAVFAGVGVEVDGVGIAFELFPFTGVEHRQRVGIAQNGQRGMRHADSGSE